MRVSRISSEGATQSVAAITSARVTVSPASGAFMAKAISASTLGWMNRPRGTCAPLSNIMSSVSTPLSGMSMFKAACIAFEVRPIFQPITCRPADMRRATSAFCTA